MGYFPPICPHSRMFGRILVEDGIGVVDMDEYAPTDGRARKPGYAARLAGHGDMAHASARLLSDAGYDHLVIRIDGTVE
jgi:hypothetical protein